MYCREQKNREVASRTQAKSVAGWIVVVLGLAGTTWALRVRQFRLAGQLGVGTLALARVLLTHRPVGYLHAGVER